MQRHVDRHDAAPNRVVLSSYLSEAELIDPVDGARAQRTHLDLLFRFVDQANPAFAHIAHHDQGRTAFEADYANIDTPVPPGWWSYPRTLTACREPLRGYSWLTILLQELLDRVGGTDTLADSGAFVEVRPLSAGGVWLLATDDSHAFDDAALLRVFYALAPVLRSGPVTLWPPPPGRPALRVIPKDTSRYPLGHRGPTPPAGLRQEPWLANSPLKRLSGRQTAVYFIDWSSSPGQSRNRPRSSPTSTSPGATHGNTGTASPASTAPCSSRPRWTPSHTATPPPASARQRSVGPLRVADGTPAATRRPEGRG